MTTSTACVLVAAMITLLAASYPFLAHLANRNSKQGNPGNNPGNPGINGKLLEDRLRAQEVLMASVVQKITDCSRRLDEVKSSIDELYRLYRE